MGLNIKNPETERLARELATATGESMTAAIAAAIREKLERIRRDRDREARLARLTAIANDCAAHLSDKARSTNIDELLYDERGLPK